MGSILDVLPAEGALFSGAAGAVPLPDGQVLLVRPGTACLTAAAEEPPGNGLAAPDDTLPVRRPGYLAAFDLRPPVPSRPAPAELEAVFRAAWPRRFEADDFARLDPYTGGMIRVAQAARLALAGGEEVVALSYRLNCGDPSNPEAAYQLKQVVNGMADAARMFQMPVVAGHLDLSAATGLRPRVEVSPHLNSAHLFIGGGPCAATITASRRRDRAAGTHDKRSRRKPGAARRCASAAH